MRDKKITAVVMSIFMVLYLLPSAVFAAAAVTLEGKLKIKGEAAVGETLSADFKEVKPEGLAEDSVSYVWSRKAAADKEDKNLKELSKEKTYTLTQEDLGSRIVLTVTGLEEKGFTGSLKVETEDVMEALPQDSVQTESSEEQLQEDSQTEAPSEEQPQENGQTETPSEEQPQENGQTETPSEEQPQENGETETPSEEQTQENEQTDVPSESGDTFYEEGTGEESSGEEELLVPDELSGSEESGGSEEPGSESVDGIPPAQEDDSHTEDSQEQTIDEDMILTPLAPSEDPSDGGEEPLTMDEPSEDTGEGSGEPGSEEVDGIPPAQEDPSASEEPGPGENPTAGDETGAVTEPEAPGVAIDGNSVLDFGTFTVSQVKDQQPQSVEIKNTGNVPLNFVSIDAVSSPNFAVNDITEPLEAGSSVTVNVWPRESVTAGTYNDTIVYQTSQGVSVTITASMTVEEDQPEQPAGPALAADQASLSFENAEAQKLVITNNSDTEIALKAATGSGYVIIDPDTVTVPAAGTQEFVIKPAESLKPGETYEETLTFTDTANAENTVSVPVTVKLPEEEKPAQSNVSADRTEVVFASVFEGYEASGEQSVKLTNSGDGAAKLSDPVSSNGQEKYFDVLLADKELAPGADTALQISPKTGLKAGDYSESFTVKDETAGKEIVITVKMSVQAVKHSLSVSPASLEFAAVKKGYGQIEAQTIVVSNNGNVEETLVQPQGTSFEVSKVEASVLTIKPGESVSFTVRPKDGLDVGNYSDTIKFASENAEASAEVSFQVIKGTATINKIETPKDITGLPNGTKKDAKSLELPSAVVIGTTAGSMNASVKWDVDGCSYDPSSTEEQSFTVTGKVTLPEGVDNDNNLTLATTIRVNVKAYAPKLAAAEDNKVTGIEYNGVYTTQSRISFDAVGAGMDNTDPRKGDTRYLPLTWSVVNTYNLKSDNNYGATFGLAQSGDYTLKVTFRQQTYNGKEWQNTDNYDTRKVPFTISKAKVTAPGQNLTPAANRRNAVRTGDSTPIAAFVIILIVAAGAIGGVLVYRKKNK